MELLRCQNTLISTATADRVKVLKYSRFTEVCHWINFCWVGTTTDGCKSRQFRRDHPNFDSSMANLSHQGRRSPDPHEVRFQGASASTTPQTMYCWSVSSWPPSLKYGELFLLAWSCASIYFYGQLNSGLLTPCDIAWPTGLRSSCKEV